MIRKLLITFIAVTCSFGCDTVVQLDVPRNNSQLVVNSLFAPDSTFGVSLYKSVFVLDEGRSQPIAGATAKVFDSNGNEVTQLSEQEEGVYTSNVSAEPGKTYEIKVSKSGYETATALSAVPADTAQVIKLETTSSSESSSSARISLWIDDPEGVDYYEVTGQSQTVIYTPKDTLYFGKKLYLNSNNATFEDFDSGRYDMFFDDKLFDGTRQKLTFRTNLLKAQCTNDNAECRDEHEVTFFVRKTSKAYYRYKQSIHQQNEVGGDPFAEPVPVYDNIENGLGIFAGFRVNKYELDVPEDQ